MTNLMKILKMKERPILFKGEMVRAIMAGAKTQTRRVVKPQPIQNGFGPPDPVHDIPCYCDAYPPSAMLWPDERGGMLNGDAGHPWLGVDRLIVKEHAWMWCEKVPNGVTKKGRPKFHYVPLRCAQIFYCANHPEKPSISVVCEYRGYPWGWRKKLGRFLPKWASRITLEIVDVHAERLNKISEADAIAEGIPAVSLHDLDCESIAPSSRYRSLWESINGAGSWAANPWVWVITFKRVDAAPNKGQ